MVSETISSHADLQALEARSDEDMFVNLVSLESVRIALESYALLRPLMMERKSWLCPQLDLLSIVAGMALELHKVEHDLFPPLMVQEAKLERGVLAALVNMKNSGIKLLRLQKDFKEALQELGGSLDVDLVSDRVGQVGERLKHTAVDVMKGDRNIIFVQELVPWMLKQQINPLLGIPVSFP